jgi:hypothetical protein
MAANDHAERGRAEPIDADFEPAHGPTGIGMGTAVALACVSALGGGALGALAPRTPALAPLLDAASPDELTQTRQIQAQATASLAEAKLKLQSIDASGGVSPEFKADYLQLKADVLASQRKLANIDVGLKLFPNGPEETAALRQRFAALEALPQDPTLATDAQLARATASLQARMGELEKRAGKVLSFEAAAGVNPADMMAQIRDLQAQNKVLEAKLNNDVGAVTTQVSTLKGQFDDVAKGAKDATNAARASYAVAAATDAARSSGPFEPAYAALVGVLPEDPNVIALAALSKKGAPTREQLRDQYSKIEIEIVRAARIGNQQGGAWGQVQASLAQFVVVRRVDDRDDSNDVVENASAKVKANDLEGAVVQLAKLQGEAAQKVAPWLEKARTRVEIDQRLAAIRSQLSKRG